MKRFAITPLIVSCGLSLLVVVAFYFIDQGIEATRQHEMLASIYSSLLTLAKWLIVTGLIVKGALNSRVKDKVND